ncbi:Maf family protein [Hyphococcus luteus]|uniref:Nucleoside triphosphate pyrophosphatase n=1 Tax=Hyphococcus luteus TaxID=2058213 RepID=A0A2S7K6R1_9PROT|nr:nucleoside triphosphate pyrophosphatase [Marinicaulis flavus]PQA88204.1 septum formation protein Maf [Marinicaulis flavus]
MSSAPRIILASGSAIRRDILTGAGVPFEVMKPEVDEGVIKDEGGREGVDLETLAMRLAEAKCLDIAAKTNAIVIGSDQIMEFKGRAYDKPASMDEARARLLETQGAAHTLINAIAVARDGRIIWRNLDRPKLVMRKLSAGEIDAYLKGAGPEILHSVGAYQIEKLGARLFERIEGDHYAVLGLSLFPLLDLLRREGALLF